MPAANEVSKDDIVMLNGAPHKVLELQHRKMARQGATVAMKFKNLTSGSTVTRSFNASERLEDADVEKRPFLFLYEHRGEYCFVPSHNRSQRVLLSREDIGEEKAKFLKPNTEVIAEVFDEKILAIELPIKVEYEVREAPPSIKGDTAAGGTKQVKLETGAVIATPLFINAGDVVRVNTVKGEYVERVEKGK
ncbi:MAG: elongation factor P [Candidatus Spechtbacterales bacterium]